MWPRVHPPDLNLASAGGLGDVLRQGAEMRASAARPRGHIRFPWKLMRNCPPLSHKERVLACGACERIVPPESRQPARGAFSIGGLEEKALRRRIGLLGLGACGEQHRRHEPSDHRDSCGGHLMLSSFQLNLCEEILTRLFAPGVRSAQRPRSLHRSLLAEKRFPRDSTGERGHGLDGTIELPAGTAASVSLRVSGAAAVITLNGKTENTLWNADIGGKEVEIRGGKPISCPPTVPCPQATPARLNSHRGTLRAGP